MRVRAVLAWREDIGKNKIRIPKVVRDAIGVDLGDRVKAAGPGGSKVLTAIIADRSEIGQRVAGIDAATRRALGIERGGHFTVSKPQSSRRRPQKSTSQWLFNYGSNHPEQLESRLEHPITTTSAAYLSGYSLQFLGYSRNRKGGVAGLIKKRGAEACGYVAKVTDSDLDILDTWEGVRSGCYYRATLPVMVADPSGEQFMRANAVVYLPGPARLDAQKHYPPSKEYLDALEKTIFTFWDVDGECRDYLNEALQKVRRNPICPDCGGTIN
jgi:hypothetical protein